MDGKLLELFELCALLVALEISECLPNDWSIQVPVPKLIALKHVSISHDQEDRTGTLVRSTKMPPYGILNCNFYSIVTA